MTDLTSRHPATQQIMKHFTFSHLPHDLGIVSSYCHDTAHLMLQALPDGPELTTGLRKLLEAKDCFVRAAIDSKPPEPVKIHEHMQATTSVASGAHTTGNVTIERPDLR